MGDDRYVECDTCGERYVGEEDIRRWTREVNELDEAVVDLCITCLDYKEEQRYGFDYPTFPGRGLR